jgi:NADH pyrophosphatase NudC (nudix superfamily)
MKYCPECASTLDLKRIDGVERKACTSRECSFVHWDNPVPVVAALVQYEGQIVLVRNSLWPKGMFSLVTGYLERNETPEEAVVREVKEELGLIGKVQEFIGCYSFTEKNQVILAHWLVASGELKTGNEITEVMLLSREELKLWQFGRLALTSVVVKQWLEQTTPNMALQPTSPLTRRRV